MNLIEYVKGNKSLLDRIRSLWEGLNQHHADVSKYFSVDFLKFTFEARMALLDKVIKEDDVLIEIAVCTKSQKDVGYCISTVNSEQKGEIDSIYLIPDYRNLGIGKNLMVNAINWLESKNVTEKLIAVVFGNEQSFEFYAKFGFYPRITMLSQRP